MDQLFDDLAAKMQRLKTSMAKLRQYEASGEEYDLDLPSAEWTKMPGRQTVLLFPIPHPLGKTGLWMAAYYVFPNSEYTGSHIAERRTVTVLEGELECNGHCYRKGESLIIESHESTAWKVTAGAAGVTLYESPD